MTSDGGDSPHEWRYAPYRSLRGALQRGRGIAVARLRDQREHAELVYECTSRDTRWDWQVDDRYTYLARLLRDLRLDPAPLVAQLHACGPHRPWPQPDPADDDNQFNLAVGILETLARAGNTQAREALRGYVRDGVRWIDALEEADQRAGRTVRCPTLFLWSTHDDMEDLYGDPLAVWRPWVDDLRGHPIDSGHHIAEENPDDLTTALHRFLA